MRHYFAATNPVDGFRADDGKLVYDNLAVEAGLATEASTTYRYRWFRFDNDAIELHPLGEPGTATMTSIPIPESPAPYLMVRIRTHSDNLPAWLAPVDVYLRRRGGTRTVVGIERGHPGS